MIRLPFPPKSCRYSAITASLMVAFYAGLAAPALIAQDRGVSGSDTKLYPGNLVVSRSLYDNRAANVTVGEILPPNCQSTQAGCAPSTGAVSNGLYPFVFNNDGYDTSFGITSRIFLDQITTSGNLINSIEVPNSLSGVNGTGDQLVTSFSSKSELGLHLSTDGQYLTFMGYVAPVNALDVSNSNTPDAVDPTNPVGEESLPRNRARRQQWPVPLHRDQCLQREQRPRRHPEQHRQQ